MDSRNWEYVDIQGYSDKVTGSCTLMKKRYADGTVYRGIVDCGLVQDDELKSSKEEYFKRNQLAFDASELNFAIITHVHCDHIGLLPLLIKNGFKGKIYLTNISYKLIPLALNDNHKVSKGITKKDNTCELYTQEDVDKTLDICVPCEYNEKIRIEEANNDIEIIFLPNGHIVGAASIFIRFMRSGYDGINLLFSGDYNNKNLFFNVKPISKYIRKQPLTIIQESTYGTMNSDQITEVFEKNIVYALLQKSSVVIPVFSLGRSQEILYYLKNLQKKRMISKDIPIYFDGNLAFKYTNLFINEDLGIKNSMKNFLPQNLVYVDKDLRNSLLNDNSTKIIVTTSGMGSYGPAQTYLPEYLTRKNCLIHFTGYVAPGTLGDKLYNTKHGGVVEIGGVYVKKMADVQYTNEFSAHAKADEMINFLNQFTNLKLVLINHGEPETRIKFIERVINEVNVKKVCNLNTEYFYRINPYGFVKSVSNN